MTAPLHADEVTSAWVNELQRRHFQFEHDRREELRQFKHDFISQFITDHIILGDKVSYDAVLQAMLTDQEHQLLTTDPQFTRAWRIFVDVCWTKRLLIRTAVIVGAIAVLMLIILAFVLAIPYVAGTKGGAGNTH